jgi:fluoride exporter
MGNGGPGVVQRLRGLLRHKMLLVMLGGALGTGLRFWIGQRMAEYPWAGVFPFATLFINVTGSFILAAAAVLIRERLPIQYQDLFLLVGTGFCGGYTTFSTFEWETYKLVQNRSWLLVLANVFGSVIGGFLGVVAAVALVGLFFPKR